MRSMADMLLLETEQRRKRINSRAADLFNAYISDCIEANVKLDDLDVATLWDAAIAAGRTEDDHRGKP